MLTCKSAAPRFASGVRPFDGTDEGKCSKGCLKLIMRLNTFKTRFLEHRGQAPLYVISDGFQAGQESGDHAAVWIGWRSEIGDMDLAIRFEDSVDLYECSEFVAGGEMVHDEAGKDPIEMAGGVGQLEGQALVELDSG